MFEDGFQRQEVLDDTQDGNRQTLKRDAGKGTVKKDVMTIYDTSGQFPIILRHVTATSGYFTTVTEIFMKGHKRDKVSRPFYE